MIMRSYQYRLYPNVAQAERLTAWQIACHEIQRLCILQRRIAWKKRSTLYSGQPPLRPQPSRSSQCHEVTQLRQADPVLADVPAIAMQMIVERVDLAYQRMFQRWKQRQRATVRWADRPTQIGLVFRGARDGTMVQPRGRHADALLAAATKLGYLRLRYHRPLPAEAEIRRVHISRAADGWYITFVCQLPAPPARPPAPRPVNGVDLGCIHEGAQQRVAVVDDGRIYRSTDGLKRNARRLATLQKMISPRRVRGSAKAADPHSKRTARRRERVARLHQRIAQQREHTSQYIARRLADTADTTVFEAINWTALRRRGKTGRARQRKRGLNRAMSTASPGRVVALTAEKAEQIGRAVVKVNARGTSQQCSACGATGSKKRLDVRRWRCDACGAEHDRDVNAARNIRQRFERDTGPCRPGVRGEERASQASEGASMNREGGSAASVRATHDRVNAAQDRVTLLEGTTTSG